MALNCSDRWILTVVYAHVTNIKNKFQNISITPESFQPYPQPDNIDLLFAIVELVLSLLECHISKIE